MKHFQIIILYAVSVYSLLSQNVSSTVSGSIFQNQKNSPMQGANVVMTGPNGIELGSSSDSKGKFRIKNVPPGDYLFKVSFIGYEEL